MRAYILKQQFALPLESLSLHDLIDDLLNQTVDSSRFYFASLLLIQASEEGVVILMIDLSDDDLSFEISEESSFKSLLHCLDEAQN